MSRVIHMLKGLPASGKTTMALEMVREGTVKRVSKDDLRAMLHGGAYSPSAEVFVIQARNALVACAIGADFDVVIDDTNLNPEHEKALRQLAEYMHVQFDVVPVRTPVDECVRRDRERGMNYQRSVGEAVIREMAHAYGWYGWPLLDGAA